MRHCSLLFMCSLLLSTATVKAQDPDSLWDVWSDKSRPDTARLSAMADFIWNIQYSAPDSAERCARNMLELAKTTGIARFEGSALELLANSYYIRGDVNSALPVYFQCVQLHHAQRDADGVAGALGNIGNMYTELGQFEKARRYQQQSLDLYTAIGREEGMGQGNNNLGRILLLEGDLAGATAHLLKSITHNEKAGNKGGVLSGFGNLSVIMAQQKDFTRATEYALRGMAIAEELNNQQARSSFLANLGGFAVEDKRYVEGISYHEMSLKLAREMGNKAGETLALYNIGSAYGELGQHQRAYELLVQSLDIARAMNEPYREALALSGLAAASQGLGRHEEAAQHGELSLRILQGIGATVDIGTVAAVLRKAYQSAGRSDRALAMYELEVQMNDSVTSEEAQRGVLRQEYSFENEKRALADSLQFASEKALQVKEIQKQKVIRNGFVGGFALVALFAGVFLFQRNRITKEKARSEELLLNILPEEVAKELKDKGEADARLIDEATILFTDFKGFTTISEQLTARELVEELNVCFKAFDNIITARGIEKIKTIGDAYMCAGGLSEPKTSSPLQVVHAALEMQRFMQQRKAERTALHKPAFDMRLGIHTGPVVAGIVGVKKFQYDIWGDTVNIAARMESSGEIGQVNISEATHALVKETLGLHFAPRGKVQAKGKGEMEMWFVEKNV